MEKKTYITIIYDNLLYGECLCLMQYIHKIFGIEPIKEAIIDNTIKNKFKLYFLIKPYVNVRDTKMTASDYINSKPFMLDAFGEHAKVSSIII